MLERQRHPEELIAWRGEMPTYNVYTAGLAGERFLRELKDNARIMGLRCQSCSVTYVPPRVFCPACFAGLTEWVEVSGEGEVQTFTVAELDGDGNRLESPQVLAMIALGGASGGLIHRIGEVDPREVRIGMKVEAVFKEAVHREGSILDISLFRPKYEGRNR